MAFNDVYKGKKIFITGNTGFKGAWLSTWLLSLGAEVFGYSLNIPTNPAMFEAIHLKKRLGHYYGDVQKFDELNSCINEIRPDFIFHLAAQAIVSTSYKDPLGTVSTNVMGTANICEVIRRIDWPCVCVLITSDKAYENVEWIWGYRETDALGGSDVYSGSKGASELVIKSYWRSFIQHKANIKLGVARAGNVIGGGDWAKDRIVVDSIRAFSTGIPVEIRCPAATRPWQHVLEPLSGYLNLGQYLFEGKIKNGEPYNFGPHAEQMKTVLELVRDIAELWELEANQMVKVVENLPFQEATRLKLNCDKALTYLHWRCTLHYEECVQYVADWYRSYYCGNNNMYDFTVRQIKSYMDKAVEQKIEWAL